MQPWIPLFFKYYGFLLLTMLLLYGSGRLLLHFFSSLIRIRGFYQDIFFSLSIGVFTVVIISSVAVTHFITISTGFFIIGSFLVYELYRFKTENKKVFSLKYSEEKLNARSISLRLAGLLFLSLLFFSWQAVMIIKDGPFPFIVPERDYVFYADLAETMWKTGQENHYLTGNLVSENFFGLIPYHYFEIWFGSFFSWLYQSENLVTTHLIVFPLFFLMMALSLFSIVESVSRPSIHKRVIAVMLLSIGAIPFITDSSSEYCKWLTAAESPLVMEKSSHHYWIAVIGFLFMMNNFFSLGFVVFLSLIFVSATLLPGIALGGAAFLVLCIIFRWQRKPEVVRESVYFSVAVLFFLLVYAFFGNFNYSFRTYHPVLYYTDLNPVIEKGIDFFTIKVMLVELAVRIYKIPFELIIVLLPFILMIFFLVMRKKELFNPLKLPVIFICCAYLAAVFCFGFFYRMFDSGQFFEGLYFMIFSFISVTLIIFLNLPLGKKTERFFMMVIVAIFIIKMSVYSCNRIIQISFFKDVYSDEYLQAISETNLKGSIGTLGICYNILPDSKRISGRNAQISNRLGGYTDFFPCYSQTFDVSLIEMNEWDYDRWGEMERIIVESSPFSQYVIAQRKAGKFAGIYQSQVDFIEEFNIKYIIVARNAIVNPMIESRVFKTISDPKSGERFMLLK